jgi:hypothetical protein
MPELTGKLDTSVNGPEGLPPFDGDAWEQVDWRCPEEQVRRLRGRIFKGLPGPRAAMSGMRGPEGAPVQQCTGATRPRRAPASMTNRQYRRRNLTAQSTH